jgi:hypothetical protein
LCDTARGSQQAAVRNSAQQLQQHEACAHAHQNDTLC